MLLAGVVSASQGACHAIHRATSVSANGVKLLPTLSVGFQTDAWAEGPEFQEPT